jgi:hypothetical protein
VRSVSTVDAPEGRVASVAINCLRSTSMQIMKDLRCPVRLQAKSRWNRFLKTR